MRLLFIVNFVCCVAVLSAQYITQPLKDNVQALQVYRGDDPLLYPVIELGAGSTVSIKFDILDAEPHQITYSIIHCDAEWNTSDLVVNEYLDGFQNSYVDDYEYSENTNVDYVNYKLEIPNEDVNLTISGNYVAFFYDEDDKDTLLTACFSLVESKVSIVGNVGGLSTSGNTNATQQLNFTVNCGAYKVDRPIDESKVIVKQNSNAYPPVVYSTPTFIREGQLVYDHNPVFSFPGGDEYHTFEATNLTYAGKGIETLRYFAPYYHLDLRQDKMRQMEKYYFDEDINGKYIIRNENAISDDDDLESDYIVVHFSLPMEMPILDGRVYVSGDFNYNVLDASSEMIYNVDRKAYEGHCLLKQGYYDYRYFVVKTDGTIKSSPIELDAYQTENDYQIFFYHCPMGERYDHLIGYQVVNSLNNR